MLWPRHYFIRCLCLFLHREALFLLRIFLNSSLPQPPGLLLSAFKNPQVKLSTEIALWVVVKRSPGGGWENNVHAISQAFLSPLRTASRLLWMSRMGFLGVIGIVCSPQRLILSGGEKKQNRAASLTLARRLSCQEFCCEDHLCSVILVPGKNLVSSPAKLSNQAGGGVSRKVETERKDFWSLFFFIIFDKVGLFFFSNGQSFQNCKHRKWWRSEMCRAERCPPPDRQTGPSAGVYFYLHTAAVGCGRGGELLTVGIIAQLLSRRGRLSNSVTFRQTDRRTRARSHTWTQYRRKHAAAGLSRSVLALRHGWKVGWGQFLKSSEMSFGPSVFTVGKVSVELDHPLVCKI